MDNGPGTISPLLASIARESLESILVWFSNEKVTEIPHGVKVPLQKQIQQGDLRRNVAIGAINKLNAGYLCQESSTPNYPNAIWQIFSLSVLLSSSRRLNNFKSMSAFFLRYHPDLFSARVNQTLVSCRAVNAVCAALSDITMRPKKSSLSSSWDLKFRSYGAFPLECRTAYQDVLTSNEPRLNISRGSLHVNRGQLLARSMTPIQRCT